MENVKGNKSYKCVYSFSMFSAGIEFLRQDLTFYRRQIVTLKTVPALEEPNYM